ncbi:MAG: ATP:cob(I)alamin adenosyltransferase [Actinomycetes bacterium]|jgi:cob(I)alamin adenosyltransferase|nr:ATP:cob(I)alamin adenosyltransferase [Actinomycetes bacterium]
MRYYTGHGDTGTTRTADGRPVPKDDPYIIYEGLVDGAQCALGFAAVRAGADGFDDLQAVLGECERCLFAVSERDADARAALLSRLEQLCDAWTPARAQDGFVLPGGSELSARIELARVAVRAAERAAVTAGVTAAIPVLNRLSDLLYALARSANRLAGIPDTPV